MSQHAMTLSNQPGASFRTDLNNAIAALVSNSSGATSPAVTFAYMTWADTTSGLMKQRNAANSAWIEKGDLASADWGFLKKSNPIVTGLLTLDDGADIASASTVDLTAATGNTVRITGTTAITAFTMTAGQQMELIAVGALPLTYNATTMNINGGVSYTCAAGDRLSVTKDGAGVVRVNVTKQDGTSVSGGAAASKLSDLDATVAGNDLTITVNAGAWDFRSTTLTDGTPVSRTLASPVSLVVPNGATLGVGNGVSGRFVVGLIDNSGVLEPFVINIAGGNQLDETNLITTTTISTAADSNNVAYSTTGRASKAYRIIGFLDITEATAGVYASAPTLVQPCGGQALASLSSLGYGQTLQNVTGSRARATTYYNTTGKPIFVAVNYTLGAAGVSNATVNGGSFNGSGYSSAGSSVASVFFLVPVGGGYSSDSSGSPTINTWFELR